MRVCSDIWPNLTNLLQRRSGCDRITFLSLTDYKDTIRSKSYTNTTRQVKPHRWYKYLLRKKTQAKLPRVSWRPKLPILLTPSPRSSTSGGGGEVSTTTTSSSSLISRRTTILMSFPAFRNTSTASRWLASTSVDSLTCRMRPDYRIWKNTTVKIDVNIIKLVTTHGLKI